MTMNCKECRKKMTQAACGNKCTSYNLNMIRPNENELNLTLEMLQRRTNNNKKNYYLDETKFCLTVTNFCFAKCGNRIKIGERLPQVHIKMTREQPLQIKSGRGCECCANFDWWNGQCMRDKCKRVRF